MANSYPHALILCATLLGGPFSQPSFASDTQVPPATEAPKYTWTLGEVKKYAFEHNPDLKSAQANYDAARMSVGVAVSGYLPHVDLHAKYEQTTLPEPSAGATSQLGLALPYKFLVASVSQTIFDFGKTLSQISRTRSD